MNEMKKIRVDQILLSLMKQLANSPFSTTSIVCANKSAPFFQPLTAAH